MKIEHLTLDEERALYHTCDSLVIDCTFKGPMDGESCLKESRNIEINNCEFCLRYPLWHVQNFAIQNSLMHEDCRASLWYDKNGIIKNTVIDGVKSVRECDSIKIDESKINSEEFGWKSKNLDITSTSITAVYGFFDSKNINIHNVTFKGKYSFQYTENVTIEDSNLDTKDAFWHSKNVTVRNTKIRGEYLGWYSENLTLINCEIIGIQPLCYAKGLKIIDCTMENCNLAFEYAEVEATINSKVESIKNPKAGKIVCKSVDTIIKTNNVYDCNCEIIETDK